MTGAAAVNKHIPNPRLVTRGEDVAHTRITTTPMICKHLSIPRFLNLVEDEAGLQVGFPGSVDLVLLGRILNLGEDEAGFPVGFLDLGCLLVGPAELGLDLTLVGLVGMGLLLGLFLVGLPLMGLLLVGTPDMDLGLGLGLGLLLLTVTVILAGLLLAISPVNEVSISS